MRAFSARVNAVEVIQLWWRSSVAAYALLAAPASVALLSSCRHCSSSAMKCIALHALPVSLSFGQRQRLFCAETGLAQHRCWHTQAARSVQQGPTEDISVHSLLCCR